MCDVFFSSKCVACHISFMQECSFSSVEETVFNKCHDDDDGEFLRVNGSDEYPVSLGLMKYFCCVRDD